MVSVFSVAPPLRFCRRGVTSIVRPVPRVVARSPGARTCVRIAVPLFVSAARSRGVPFNSGPRFYMMAESTSEAPRLTSAS